NAMIAEMPPTQARMIGWKILMRCLTATMLIAAIVATKVAIMQGIKISVGLEAFNAILSPIIVIGINVNPDACRQRNITCALDAFSLFGFNSCRLSMALMPNGVA